MEVVFIVVVLLLNEPILSIVLVLLLEIALCRVALVKGFLAGQEPIVFAAIFWMAPLRFEERPGGRRVHESDRLHAKFEIGAETDICRTWCRRVFLKLLVTPSLPLVLSLHA